MFAGIYMWFSCCLTAMVFVEILLWPSSALNSLVTKEEHTYKEQRRSYYKQSDDSKIKHNWQKPVLFEWISERRGGEGREVNSAKVLEILIMALFLTTQSIELYLSFERDQLVSPLLKCRCGLATATTLPSVSAFPSTSAKNEPERNSLSVSEGWPCCISSYPMRCLEVMKCCRGSVSMTNRKDRDTKVKSVSGMTNVNSHLSLSRRACPGWFKSIGHLLIFILLWVAINVCILPLYAVLACVIIGAIANVLLTTHFLYSVYYSYLQSLAQSRPYLWKEILANEMLPIQQVTAGSVLMSIASGLTFLFYLLFFFHCSCSSSSSSSPSSSSSYQLSHPTTAPFWLWIIPFGHCCACLGLSYTFLFDRVWLCTFNRLLFLSFLNNIKKKKKKRGTLRYYTSHIYTCIFMYICIFFFTPDKIEYKKNEKRYLTMYSATICVPPPTPFFHSLNVDNIPVVSCSVFCVVHVGANQVL
ncbi:hypothetical protein RFI_24328 [Reticulomyxa filosa]|uniref:Uncharacterized protein n=1 Tax=Reticulomyxa filosa TaxID=46433 RepID=X6MGN6_RETFI|nr:hypothetical protein RFI_24328 [Reticulomyxa filosa]|eukprot:ETO13049.1 hypothetical protein RFI_24328 [Reticulomyxa filosa]